MRNWKRFSEALNVIKDSTFLNGDEIEKKINQSFENLQMREKYTDIKISDYIKNHYQERQLFFAPNHPVNEVLMECTKRIIKSLNYDDKCKYSSVTNLFSLMGQELLYTLKSKRN